MDSSVVRRSKRIASTKKPATVNPKAKRSRISRNHKEIIIGNSSKTIDHLNLAPSKMNSHQKRSKKSKLIVPIAEKDESVSSIISTSNSPSPNGASDDLNVLRILKNSPLETCGSVTVNTIVPLRRSERLAIRIGPVSNKETIRSTKVNSDVKIWSKKIPNIKYDSESSEKARAVVAPTVFNEGEIVMAKMSGHIIWPAKILDINKVTVNVRFYGDYTTGIIFKSKLIKFQSFLLNYTFDEKSTSHKLMLRHKGILEALHEVTFK